MVLNIIKLILLAMIGGLIGWITNKIAIKLMFRPLDPVKLPLLNIRIQGLIPKRRKEIAEVIGNTVEQELLSLDDIIEKALEKHEVEKIKTILKVKIKSAVKEKLPSIIPDMFKNMILSYIDEFIDDSGEDMLKDLSDGLINNIKESVSISNLVEEKINSYDMLKIEDIVISIANKELKHIELLGGVLGFMIGILQGLLIILI